MTCLQREQLCLGGSVRPRVIVQHQPVLVLFERKPITPDASNDAASLLPAEPAPLAAPLPVHLPREAHLTSRVAMYCVLGEEVLACAGGQESVMM